MIKEGIFDLAASAVNVSYGKRLMTYSYAVRIRWNVDMHFYLRNNTLKLKNGDEPIRMV